MAMMKILKTPQDEFETAEDDFENDGSEDDYDNIDISEYVNDGDDEVGRL